MNAPLLQIENIDKSFFGVKVLKNVSFTVPHRGAVGVVGENGAGKSTLMNILGGNLTADAGQLRLDGSIYAPANPQDAARRGIAFIHQELNLFPNLSIAENLFLTSFPRAAASPFIQRGAIRQRAARLLGQVGLDVSPDALVETLSAGERQLVEVAKALSIEARLIILDEPTTSLSVREAERLFELVATLRVRGIAMIYISHMLAEVFRLCDELVVLRDGAVVGCGPAANFTKEKLVSLMVGRDMHQMFPTRNTLPRHEPLLAARNISQPGVVENVSFTLHRGEVLGLAGLMGAGRSELARILFGLDPHARGEITLRGDALRHLSPRTLIRRGMAFLTENRRSEGLCLDASVGDNLALASLRHYARTPFRWLSSEPLRAAIEQIRDVVKLDKKTRHSQPARTLSGGNQQKVVLGKWLLRDPQVLVLDEPTRGIDVGARFEIYRLIHELADGGAGILVISSEIEELIGLCDRILVMRSGEIVDELGRAEFDRERVLRAALGASNTPEPPP